MGRKDRRKSGQKRAAKVKARQQRLADQEAARERHARLVVERSGDLRFVQREQLPGGGRALGWDPTSEVGAEPSDVFRRRHEKFRDKFGRDPGPGDPLFFDPDADDPVPLSVDAFNHELDRLADAADEIGVDPALIKAWRDLGYVVTEENQHLFSAAEIEAWNDAVEQHWIEDEDDIGIEDLLHLLTAEISSVVEQTLKERSPQHARDLAIRIIDTDIALAEAGENDPDGSLGLTTAFAVVARWLAGLRDERPEEPVADECLGWVGTALGPECAAASTKVAGLLGAERHAERTVQEIADELRAEFIPAMVWLTAGAVAIYGEGDVGWLQRYERDVDQDVADR